MPKQRNHPHQHRHGRQTEEMELPEPRFSAIWGGFRYIYPRGWVTRSSASGMRRMYLAALAGAGALLLVAALFAIVFGGH